MYIGPHPRPAIVAEEPAASRRLALAACCAVLLHAIVFAGLLLWPHGTDELPPPPENAVQMVFAPPPTEAQPAPEPPQLDEPAEPPPPAAEPPPEPPPLATEPSPPEPPPLAIEPAPAPAPVPPPPPLVEVPSAAAPPARPAPLPAPTTPTNQARPRAPKSPPTSAASTPSRPATQAPKTIIVPPRPIGGGADVRRPDYPPIATRRHEQGRVVVRASISADGAPIAVSVVQSSGSKALDDAALDALRRARFTPQTVDGKPVAGTFEQPFNFRLEN